MTAKGMEHKLEKIVNKEQVIATAELCAGFEVDGKTPAVIVRPHTAEEAAAILALCAQEGAAVIPWGGGTRMGVGNTPREFDVALDLADLDEIADFDAANLTLSAGPGSTLGALQEQLGERSQFLPLDPALAEQATLGGAFAANAFGPSRLRYGSARDLVLGLQVALPSGELMDLGGRTMKNVAGYDLTRLFVGSFGSLGVITRVNCRLLPLPAASQTLACGFGATQEAFACVGRILDSKLLPTRLDVIQDDAGLNRPQTAAALVIGLDGSPETVERQARDLRGLTAEGGALWVEGLDAPAAATLTRLIRDLPATTKARLVVRAGLPLAAQGRFWEGAAALLAGLPTPALLARAGLGFVYALVDAEPTRLAALAEALRALAGELEGYAVFERLPAELKAGLDVWGPARDDLVLMQALKAKFDPQGILNPGRFVGRL